MKINNKAELDAVIIELEKRKQFQEALLIEQYKTTRDSLTPVNIIKDSFKKISQAPGIQGTILKTVAGVGIAVLSNRLLPGKTSSILKKVLGGVAEFAVAKSAVSNTDKIKAYGISIYRNLFRKRSNHEETKS